MISTTYIAGAIAVITFVLPFIGLDISDTALVSKTVTEIAGVISILYVFIGRYRAGGINAFGIRKAK